LKGIDTQAPSSGAHYLSVLNALGINSMRTERKRRFKRVEVDAIREKAASGQCTQCIAQEYGVTRSTIERVIMQNAFKWGHRPDPRFDERDHDQGGDDFYLINEYMPQA
jgi:hypothetical protein